MKKIYSFLGLPASGKGTQAKMFSEERSLPLISVGDLIRDEIENNPDAPDVKDMEINYDKGVPQEDSIIFRLIKKRLENEDKGVVLDNFPFSKKQAEFINDFAEKNNWEPPMVINIEIKPEVSFKRISTRLVCPKCNKVFKSGQTCDDCGATLEHREDDNVQTLKNRIDFYLPRINEIKELYKDRLINISGEKTISEVKEEIDNKVQ